MYISNKKGNAMGSRKPSSPSRFTRGYVTMRAIRMEPFSTWDSFTLMAFCSGPSNPWL